ncbi:hypothetical protein ES702_00904 [subsurface metagenome]
MPDSKKEPRIKNQVVKIENLEKERKEALKHYLGVQLIAIQDLRKSIAQFTVLPASILTFVVYILFSKHSSMADKGFLTIAIFILLITIILSVRYIKIQLESDIEGLKKAKEKYDELTNKSIEIESEILERKLRGEPFEDLSEERDKIIELLKPLEKKGEADYSTDWLYRLFIISIVCFGVGFIGISNIGGFLVLNKYGVIFSLMSFWLKVFLVLIYLIFGFATIKAFFRKTEKFDLRIDTHPSTVIWSIFIILISLIFWPIVLLIIAFKLLSEPFSNSIKKLLDKFGIENKSWFGEE